MDDLSVAYNDALAVGNFPAAHSILIWSLQCRCEYAVSVACGVFGILPFSVVLDDQVQIARADAGVIRFNPAIAQGDFTRLLVVVLHEIAHLLIPGASELQADEFSGAGARLLGLSFQECYSFVCGQPEGIPHPPGPERAAAFHRGWRNPDWGRGVVAKWQQREASKAAFAAGAAAVIACFLFGSLARE